MWNHGTQGGGRGPVLNSTPLHTVELSNVNISEHFVSINVVNTNNKIYIFKKHLNVCELLNLAKFAN